MLTLNRHSDARAFLAHAEPWLMTREIEHGVVLQSARQARANDAQYERPMYWATIEDGGQLSVEIESGSGNSRPAVSAVRSAA